MKFFQTLFYLAIFMMIFGFVLGIAMGDGQYAGEKVVAYGLLALIFGVIYFFLKKKNNK